LRILDYPAAAMLCCADTKVRGRFSETRCGPSRRCARNASGALENFACYPQKTFSTSSAQSRRSRAERFFDSKNRVLTKWISQQSGLYCKQA
jgi:hypothetical protein